MEEEEEEDGGGGGWRSRRMEEEDTLSLDFAIALVKHIKIIEINISQKLTLICGLLTEGLNNHFLSQKLNLIC